MSSPLFRAAREVINAYDPIGLLADGAPEDEYDPEVLDLVRWRGALTADDVIGVFVHWFGADYQLPQEQARRVADAINGARALLLPER